MKKISIICLLMGVLSLASGLSLILVKENNKQKQINALKTSIINDYEDFKIKVEAFSSERTTIYDNLNKIYYLTDLQNNYEALINEYTKYELTLKEIDQVSSDLKVNCFEREFAEVNINNKISAFVINYEQAVNYFIQDVNNFNEKVRKYNEWVKNVQVSGTYVELKEYSSSYTEYVDINNDNVYEGVNE